MESLLKGFEARIITVTPSPAKSREYLDGIQENVNLVTKSSTDSRHPYFARGPTTLLYKANQDTKLVLDTILEVSKVDVEIQVDQISEGMDEIPAL